MRRQLPVYTTSYILSSIVSVVPLPDLDCNILYTAVDYVVYANLDFRKYGRQTRTQRVNTRGSRASCACIAHTPTVRSLCRAELSPSLCGRRPAILNIFRLSCPLHTLCLACIARVRAARVNAVAPPTILFAYFSFFFFFFFLFFTEEE